MPRGKMKTHEEFVRQVCEKLGDDYEVRSTYVGAKSPITMYHRDCKKEYVTTPSPIVSHGSRCHWCFGGVRKMHDDFVKEVSDLTKGEYRVLGNYKQAHTLIDFYHVSCSTKFKTTPSSFLSQDTRCPVCTIENLRQERARTHEQFVSEVEDLVGEEYIVLGDVYKNGHTKILMKHNKYNGCKHEFEMTPTDFINSKHRCPLCFGNIKKTTEQYKREVFEKVGDEFVVVGEYKNNRISVLMIHQRVGCNRNLLIAPQSFLAGTRCKYCSKKVKKDTEMFVQDVYEKHGNEYIITGEYRNAKTKVSARHENCGHEWDVLPNNLLKFGCPSCKQSHGEKRVETFLKMVNILYRPQYRIEECRNMAPLPFDFAIFNAEILNCLIEYDGEQHFRNVECWPDAHEKTKASDKIKNQYCADNNIKLIRIPYTEFNRIEEILSDELSEIIDHNNLCAAI